MHEVEAIAENSLTAKYFLSQFVEKICYSDNVSEWFIVAFSGENWSAAPSHLISMLIDLQGADFAHSVSQRDILQILEKTEIVLDATIKVKLPEWPSYSLCGIEDGNIVFLQSTDENLIRVFEELRKAI